MKWRQLGLVASVLVPALVHAQDVATSERADSTSLFAAIFRVAAVHGQLTSHSDAVPQVICLARRGPLAKGAEWISQYASPDSGVVARVRERIANVRPLSECRVEPRSLARDNRSAVTERSTGRRAILIWVNAPQYDAAGELKVRVGYYEHGLSSAEWVCAVRRMEDEWLVNACRLVLMS